MMQSYGYKAGITAPRRLYVCARLCASPFLLDFFANRLPRAKGAVNCHLDNPDFLSLGR